MSFIIIKSYQIEGFKEIVFLNIRNKGQTNDRLKLACNSWFCEDLNKVKNKLDIKALKLALTSFINGIILLKEF